MNNTVLRLAIVSTHPIQYNAPWFKLLAEHAVLQVKVFYTWSQAAQGAKYDPGFGKVIEWDIPLLEGYEYEFIENIAKDPGPHHFAGMNNPSLIKEIKSWQPNAVLIFGWSFKSHLACMRYFKGKLAVLFRGDSTLLDETPGIRKWIRRFFLKWVYASVDHALYVGSHNKAYFLAHGLKEAQLHLAPHAVDNDRFNRNAKAYEQDAADWRRKLGISDDHFVVLFAGKLETKKNPEFILNLAASVENDRFRFVFVGNGPLENELKIKAAKDKRITFLDFQNQQKMPVVYRLGDVFILPSKGPGETWGLAVNEAMACGKPVIVSSKAGCAADLVEDTRNGMIIKQNNLNECVSYLYALQNDHLKKREAGLKSLNIISRFSFNNIVHRIEQLLIC
jgi:glycosyltransferase involved in cell wall biosynthesis